MPTTVFSLARPCMSVEPDPKTFGINCPCKVPHDLAKPDSIRRLIDLVEDRWRDCGEGQREAVFSECLQELFGNTTIEDVLLSCLCQLAWSSGLRDTLGKPGEYVRIIAICARARSLVLRLIRENFTCAPCPSFLCWFDEYIKYRFGEWASGIQHRLLPRPNNIGGLDSAKDLIGFYYEYTAAIPIAATIPLADKVFFSGFGEYQIAFIDHLVDFFLSRMLQCQEYLFLTKKVAEYTRMCLETLHKSYFRLRGQLAYVRLTWERSCTRTMLRARSSNSLSRFMSSLEGSGNYVRICGEDRVEFLARSIFEDPERRRLFEGTIYDASGIFGDEFKISLIPPVERDTMGEGPLIMVEGRNVWRKNVWVNDICQQFDLLLLDHACSPSEQVGNWRIRVAFCCELAALCMLWGLEKVIENASQLIPAQALFRMFNYTCFFTAESQGNFGSSTSRLSPILWLQCSKYLSKWIVYTLEFTQHGSMSGLLDNFLPPLDFLNKMLNRCSDLRYIDYDAMLDALTACEKYLTASGAKMERVLEREQERDRDFLLYHLRKSIARCRNRGQVEDAELLSVCFPRLPGVVLPNVIGQGSFGSVYRCFDLSLNKSVAIKEIKTPNPSLQDTEDLFQEANYLKYLHHGHIVEVYDVIRASDCIYIKMENCTGGSLKRFIARHGPLEGRRFRFIAFGILHGLYFLHGNHIVHGDLKPANILKNQFDHIRLVDFGAAQQLAQTGTKRAINLGTAQYAAPEVLLEGQVSLKSDIWSLGCTFFYMATGLNPWGSSSSLPGVILRAHSRRLFDPSPLRKRNLDPRAIKIIESCLQYDPDKRPVVTELQMNDYFFNT